MPGGGRGRPALPPQRRDPAARGWQQRPAGGAAGPSPAPPEPACIHGACLGVPAEGHKIQKETRKMTLANVLHLSPVFEWWPSTWDTYPRSMLLTAGSAGEGWGLLQVTQPFCLCAQGCWASVSFSRVLLKTQVSSWGQVTQESRHRTEDGQGRSAGEMAPSLHLSSSPGSSNSGGCWLCATGSQRKTGPKAPAGVEMYPPCEGWLILLLCWADGGQDHNYRSRVCTSFPWGRDSPAWDGARGSRSPGHPAHGNHGRT